VSSEGPELILIQIANYEVLVCASQLRWGFSPAQPEAGLTQGTVVLAQQRVSSHRSKHNHTEVDVFNTTLVESDIPRFIPDIFDVRPDREAGLKRLACVFLNSPFRPIDLSQ
jgi:hypothetical protein